MVKLPFGKNKEKEKRDEEYLETQGLTETGRPSSSTPLPQEYLASLGTSYYLLMDEDVHGMLKRNNELKGLLPAYSHLNRTTKITPKQAELLKLDYDFVILIHELNMDEDAYETTLWSTLEGLQIYGANMISDAIEGWRGKLVTEQIKVIRTVLERGQRGLLRR
jgi:hypothetical protein